jgi:hypothetical protein
MYSIDFMKLETHGKLSFHCSDFWSPILASVNDLYKRWSESRRGGT